MNKIIGFIISKKKFQSLKINGLSENLEFLELKHLNYIIYLWGFGDLSKSKIQDKYSLSFPVNSNLLDRNVLIHLKKNSILVENDWLGSIPVFYNKKSKIVSSNPNYCIRDKKVNVEALYNFCEFGYSVFEQTFFNEVKFMRYYSSLSITNNNIEISYKKDPAKSKNFFSKEKSSKEVIQSISEHINNNLNKSMCDIIIPLSGGYDSRLLLYLFKNKKRIKSFTYGICKNQEDSYEVVYAKVIAKILNIKWDYIKLDNFFNFISNWSDLYGISSHIHGMYHIEFYKKIFTNFNFKSPILVSGIFGDIWSGSIKYETINSFSDINKLGYSHGIKLNTKYLKSNKVKSHLKKSVFLKEKPYLQDDRYKSIFTVRIKIILISYLTQIPENFGIPSYTPFLNYEVVKNLLNLSKENRENRKWQKLFFESVGLNVEDMKLVFNKKNELDFQIALKSKFEPLDIRVLKKYFCEKRLLDINNSLTNKPKIDIFKNKILGISKIGSIFKMIGLKDNFSIHLNEYFILKAFEKGLKYEN